MKVFVVLVKHDKKPHQGQWFEVEGEEKEKILEILEIEDDE